MSSIFTAALISKEEIDLKIVETASAKKFHKDFWFSLRGWADLASFWSILKTKRFIPIRSAKGLLETSDSPRSLTNSFI